MGKSKRRPKERSLKARSQIPGLRVQLETTLLKNPNVRDKRRYGGEKL